MEEVYRHIDAKVDASVETLSELVSQPSVSAQRVGFDEAPGLVADVFSRYGLQSEIVEVPNGGLPSVFGYCAASPEAHRKALDTAGVEFAGQSPPTLLLYTHYDVQPVDPLELWETDPFQPTRVGDRLYGRGMSDDKGNIVARLAVLDAFREVWDGLPCNVKFLAEGEEESGSPNMPALIAARGSDFAADACIWEGGGRNAQDRPLIYLGLKGVLALELTVRKLTGDAHSSYATVLPSAAWDLFEALSTLKDVSTDEILIPGFYDDIRGFTPEESKAIDELPDETDELKVTFGNDAFVNGVEGRGLMLKHLGEPTANIAGLTAGYQGAGMKTVLPAVAAAKLDFRLVCDMDPDDIVGKLRAHLDARGFEHVEIGNMHGTRPYRTGIGSDWAGLVIDAARDSYASEPVVYPTMAGSGPMYDFGATLGIPVASAGIDHPSHKIHAPNENIRVDDFLKGARHIALVMQRFSAEYSGT